MSSSTGAVDASTTSEAAAIGAAPADENTDTASRDAHPFRAAVALTIVLIGVSLGLSLYAIPAIQHRPGSWWLNREAWDPVMAGRYVANGAFPYLYSARQGWIAGPLLPIVLGPVAAAEDVFGLTDSGLAAVPRPTAWLILCPYGLSLCAVLLYSVRRFFVEMHPHARNRSAVVLQVAAAILVGIPAGVVFLHFEDVLALTGIFLALSALERKHVRQGALWTGLAICSKQWALLAVPASTARAPRGRRVRYLAGSAVLPAILYGIPLATDPDHAAAAIFAGRAFPMLGHAQLWVDRAAPLTATAPRIVVVLIALAVPVVAARRTNRRPMSATTMLAIVFAARLLVEPVVFGYYLSPPLLFVAFDETARRGFPRWSLLIGGAMLVLFPFHPNPLAWWAGEVGLAATLGVAVFRPVSLPNRSVAVTA